jgi:hypothetical protein
VCSVLPGCGLCGLLVVPPACVTASLPPFTETQRSVDGGKDRAYVRQDPEHYQRDLIGTRVRIPGMWIVRFAAGASCLGDGVLSSVHGDTTLRGAGQQVGADVHISARQLPKLPRSRHVKTDIFQIFFSIFHGTESQCIKCIQPSGSGTFCGLFN